LVEITRLGEPVRNLPIGDGRPLAVGFDMVRDRLLVLTGLNAPLIIWHALDDGREIGRLTLDRSVRPSLGYDAERREIYAPLTTGGIGVFDEQGRWQRTIAGPAEFADLGQRSLLRMF
jgi:hypothetical protein